MRIIHHIWITVHVKPEDDENILEEKLKTFIPLDITKEKLKIKHAILKSDKSSFADRDITILELHLEKATQINKTIKHITSLLNSDQKKLLLKQLESRLDDHNNFFMRFDKEKLKNEEYILTDSGNCFHIKMTIAAFPSTRSNAIKIIEEIFK